MVWSVSLYLAPFWRILDGMHSGTWRPVWRLGHRPGLDGLRGIAILLVMVCHLGVPLTPGAGDAGVTVFFVLSGFLIVSLLLEETDRTGRISFAHFYRRRAVRLLPALYVFVGAVVAVMLVTGHRLTSWLSAAGTLFYFNNWVLAIDPKQGGTLALTWSLAIEEQFYLLAPLLILALRRRPRVLLGVCVAGALASTLLRLGLYEAGANFYRIYCATDTRVDGLLIGVGLAAAVRLWPLPGRGVWAAIGMFVVAIYSVLDTETMSSRVWLPLMVSLASVPLLIWSLGGAGVLQTALLRWVGRRAYGLYLWHFPLVQLARHYELPWPVAVAVVMPVALVVAELSWRLVEVPAQRRWRQPMRPQTPEIVAGPAGVIPTAS